MSLGHLKNLILSPLFDLVYLTQHNIGSILWSLLFLIYINELSKVIIFSSVHHFADDTNVLYVSSYSKDINEKINHDLSHLVQWLRANKISLNVSKTEIVMAICKSRNRESGNGMRGMMGTRGIRLGMQGIRVGMRGIRLRMWRIGVEMR